jgi:hypothetical protein
MSTNFLSNIDAALDAAAKGGSAEDTALQNAVKTASDGDADLAKEAAALASDLIAAGRIIGYGQIDALRKEAMIGFNFGKGADHMDGGNVQHGSKTAPTTSQGSSVVSETGSVTDKANKLPTSRDNHNPDEKEKHVTEGDLDSPAKTQNAEKLVNKVSK